MDHQQWQYQSHAEPLVPAPFDPGGGFPWQQQPDPPRRPAVTAAVLFVNFIAFTPVDGIHRDHHHPEWDVQEPPPVLPIPFDPGQFAQNTEPLPDQFDPANGFPWIQASEPVRAPPYPVAEGQSVLTFVDGVHRDAFHPAWDIQDPEAPPEQRAVDVGHFAFTPENSLHTDSFHPGWDVQEPGPVWPVPFNEGYVAFVNPAPTPIEPSDGFPWIQASEPVRVPPYPVQEGWFAFAFENGLHTDSFHPGWDVQDPEAPPEQRAVDEGQSVLTFVDGIHRTHNHPEWDVQEPPPVLPIPFDPGQFAQNTEPLPDGVFNPANGFPWIQASEPVREPPYPTQRDWFTQNIEPIPDAVVNPPIQVSEPVRTERPVDEGYFAFAFENGLHTDSFHPSWDVQEPQAPPERRAVDEGDFSLTLVDGVHRDAFHPSWDVQDPGPVLPIPFQEGFVAFVNPVEAPVEPIDGFPWQQQPDPVLPIPFDPGLFVQNVEPLPTLFDPADGFPWPQPVDPVKEPEHAVDTGWFTQNVEPIEFDPATGFPWIQASEPLRQPERAVDEGDFSLTLVDGVHRDSYHPSWDIQDPDPVLPIPFNEGLFASNVDPATVAFDPAEGFPWIQASEPVMEAPRAPDVGWFTINVDPIASPVIFTEIGCPILYTAANWTGVTFYFEVCMEANVSDTVYARLYDTTLNLPVSGSDLNTTNNAPTRLRSGVVSLVDGREYTAQFGGAIGNNGLAYVARLIAVPT